MAQIKPMMPAQESMALALNQYIQGSQMALAHEENQRRRGEADRAAQMFLEQLRGAQLGNQATQQQIGQREQLFQPQLDALRASTEATLSGTKINEYENARAKDLHKGALTLQGKAIESADASIAGQKTQNETGQFALDQARKRRESWGKMGPILAGEGSKPGEPLDTDTLRRSLAPYMGGLDPKDQLAVLDYLDEVNVRQSAQSELESVQKQLQFEMGGGFGDGQDFLSPDEAQQSTTMFEQLGAALNTSFGGANTRRILADIRKAKDNLTKIRMKRAYDHINMLDTAKARQQIGVFLSDENLAAMEAQSGGSFRFDPMNKAFAYSLAMGQFAGPMEPKDRAAAWKDVMEALFNGPGGKNKSSSLRTGSLPVGGSPGQGVTPQATAGSLLGDIETSATSKLAQAAGGQPSDSAANVMAGSAPEAFTGAVKRNISESGAYGQRQSPTPQSGASDALRAGSAPAQRAAQQDKESLSQRSQKAWDSIVPPTSEEPGGTPEKKLSGNARTRKLWDVTAWAGREVRSDEEIEGAIADMQSKVDRPLGPQNVEQIRDAQRNIRETEKRKKREDAMSRVNSVATDVRYGKASAADLQAAIAGFEAEFGKLGVDEANRLKGVSRQAKRKE